MIHNESSFDRIHLVEARETIIGRDEDCDVRLIHDAVSRTHAPIEWSEHGFQICDQRSRNGIKVNQRVVESHLLQEFDVVRIAPFFLKVYLDRERAQADADAAEESTRSSVFEPNPTDMREKLKQQLIPSLHRVYDGLMDGYCEKDIVLLCGLRKHTVHCYVTRIYKALKVHSHSKLMAKCQGDHRRMDQQSGEL